ncbi:MAG: hypothetical protein HC774_05650 [Sphingomonadales bacterium]|nr:hypothetical protein [Sphingomonadales bacterium]
MTVKGNHPQLQAKLKQLLGDPSDPFFPAASTHEKAHGRIEYRAICQPLSVDAETVSFPFAAQIARIKREREIVKTAKTSRTRDRLYHHQPVQGAL